MHREWTKEPPDAHENRGQVSERSKETVLKTVERKFRGFESHPVRHSPHSRYTVRAYFMPEPQDNAHNTGLHLNHVYNINMAESGTIKQDLNNKKHNKNKQTSRDGLVNHN